MSSDRDTILARVHGALAPLAERAPLPEWDLELVHMRTIQPATDLWAVFA